MVPRWSPGAARAIEPTPRAVRDAIVGEPPSGHLLFWDARLGAPNVDSICQLATKPGHIWHAGLRLGMNGQPGLLDFITPLWMLNRDPPPDIEATSWRLSLRACLLDSEVIRQLGGPLPDFETLEGAALELGHRYIMRGAVLRHVPAMIERSLSIDTLPLADEFRFLRRRFGSFWNGWALMRAILTRYAPPQGLLRAWWSVRGVSSPRRQTPFRHPRREDTGNDIESAHVTVLIPTIERYPYLRTLLGQLRAQTVRPREVVIVDQTREGRRDERLAADFADLPLKVIRLDRAGQCSARNVGIKASQGEHLLFIDDDDEISPDLIARHLANLRQFQAEVSSGKADEDGAGPLPYAFTYTRVGDVFPTNNTLIRREVLLRSGLFDLAYERMPRADGDLGMRIYLSGASMIYNPEISVIHHHAPRGGLRTHRARVITYASSRSRLFHRQLPGPSEVYLGLRYFTPRQVREALWIAASGTLAMRGSMLRRAAKLIIGLIAMPDTWLRIRAAYRRARAMLQDYPQIPPL